MGDISLAMGKAEVVVPCPFNLSHCTVTEFDVCGIEGKSHVPSEKSVDVDFISKAECDEDIG